VKRVLRFGLVLFFISIGLMEASVSAQTNSAILEVTASVAPHTYLIVNDDGQIIEIHSNADKEGTVVVLQDSIKGKSIDYTSALLRQYNKLRPSLNFTQPGSLYRKPGLATQLGKSVDFSSLLTKTQFQAKVGSY
jgi:hypothetical protein